MFFDEVYESTQDPKDDIRCAVSTGGLHGGKDCCLQVQGYPTYHLEEGATCTWDMLVITIILIVMVVEILDLWHDNY